jgi:hypothetical protein
MGKKVNLLKFSLLKKYTYNRYKKENKIQKNCKLVFKKYKIKINIEII